MSEKMKFVDAILRELQSYLKRCVPDPDDRQHCERLCRDLRVQYKATLNAWTETLRYVSKLEGQKKTLESENAPYVTRIESLENSDLL